MRFSRRRWNVVVALAIFELTVPAPCRAQTRLSVQDAVDTALRSSLRLSTFPASGVLAGQSTTASVAIQKPAAAPLTIVLSAQTGSAGVDPSVIIPAGATRATFKLTGMRAGVDEMARLRRQGGMQGDEVALLE